MLFKDEYAFLSNMYPQPFMAGGKRWPTSEHFYQAMKTKDLKQREAIRLLDSPYKAKRAGRKLTIRPDWDDIKLEVMEFALRRKFADLKLRAKLVAVEGDIVEDNTWGDTYWGRCNGRGSNHLGKLLMKLRAEFAA